jgi:hypothetical protein
MTCHMPSTNLQQVILGPRTFHSTSFRCRHTQTSPEAGSTRPSQYTNGCMIGQEIALTEDYTLSSLRAPFPKEACVTPQGPAASSPSECRRFIAGWPKRPYLSYIYCVVGTLCIDLNRSQRSDSNPAILEASKCNYRVHYFATRRKKSTGNLSSLVAPLAFQ